MVEENVEGGVESGGLEGKIAETPIEGSNPDVLAAAEKRRAELNQMRADLVEKSGIGYTEKQELPRIKAKMDKQDKEFRVNIADIDEVSKKLPEFLREPYCFIMGYIRTPQKVLSASTSDVNTLIDKLKEIEESLTVNLYGRSFLNKEGARRELGGLHKEYRDADGTRFRVANAILGMTEIVKDLYGVLSTYEDRKKVAKTPEDSGKLYDWIVTTKYDLRTAEKDQSDLGFEFDDLDFKVTTLQNEIELTDNIHTYIRCIIQDAKSSVGRYRNMEEASRYTHIIAQIVPQLQQKVERYRKIAELFDQNNQDRLRGAVTITSQKPEFPSPSQQNLESPFAHSNQEYERRNEERLTRIHELVGK